MNIEDRLRDALHAAGQALPPEDVPPMRLPARKRYPILAVAAAAAVIMGLTFLIAPGESTVSPAATPARGVVSVFFCIKTSPNEACKKKDATEAQRIAINERLQTLPEVESVTYESREEAYERFKALFSKTPSFVQATKQGDVPDSLRVRLRDGTEYDLVRYALAGLQGVDQIVLEK